MLFIQTAIVTELQEPRLESLFLESPRHSHSYLITFSKRYPQAIPVATAMPSLRPQGWARHQDNNKAHKPGPVICQTHLRMLTSGEKSARETLTHITAPATQLYIYNITSDGKRPLKLVIGHNQLICLGQI